MNRIARRLGALLIPLILLLPGSLAAQAQSQAPGADGGIVSHQVMVAGGRASLELEFRDGRQLSLELRDGRVLIDGSEVGSYRSGGELESAWRTLLARAVALDNGIMADLLREWSPPTGLDAQAAEATQTLQDRLRSELDRPVDSPSPAFRFQGSAAEGQVMTELLTRPDRLRALTAVAGEISATELRVYVGETVEIGAGERVSESLLGLDTDLQVDGRVEGDVILLGGSVALGSDGIIDGRLHWFDTQGADEIADRVGGGAVRIEPVPARAEAELRDEIRREVEAALESETRSRDRSSPGPVRVVSTSREGPGFFRNLGGGIVKILQTLITFGILLALGLVALHFFPRHFEVVARTARNAPGRSGLVGLASGVLAFPVWIVGIILLTVTVIGIPVMLLWLPLFPLTVAAAATLGFLAVSRNTGHWLSRRDLQGFDALDGSRPAVQLAGGLALLLGLFALAGIFQMGGAWFSFFRGLVTFVAVLLVVITGTVGLGAVVLSRGGRDPLYAGPGWAWGGADPWDDVPPPPPPPPSPPPPSPSSAPPPPAPPSPPPPPSARSGSDAGNTGENTGERRPDDGT
ncbi:MAG: hypothetical protein EA422_01765 [Gemmatimonadales bacterium]|nr:MAG: hypothetical protein EA422_01765 [Gemmatimonadales bacterium]